MIIFGMVLFVCLSGLPVFLLPFVATIFSSIKWMVQRREGRLIAKLWGKHFFSFLKVCISYLGLVLLGLLLFGRGVAAVVFLCALLGLVWEISLFYKATKLISPDVHEQEPHAPAL